MHADRHVEETERQHVRRNVHEQDLHFARTSRLRSPDERPRLQAQNLRSDHTHRGPLEEEYDEDDDDQETGRHDRKDDESEQTQRYPERENRVEHTHFIGPHAKISQYKSETQNNKDN